MKKIPKDFLWGASTSAYQVEGATDADGKGKSIQDLIPQKPGVSNFATTSDHYNHWKEDVKLMAEMGFKSYRFSISWPRIMPDLTGNINEKGMKFYENLIDELIKYKIEPIVTIWHFDLPLEIHNAGGWDERDLAIPLFVKYSKALFERFDGKVKYWLTINEQNMMIMFGHVLGLVQVTDGYKHLKNMYQQNHHMMIAQAEVMKMYHDNFGKKGGKIGPAPNIATVYPKTCDPKDVNAAYRTSAIRNWLYLDLSVKGIYNQTVWQWFESNNIAPTIKDGDMEIIAQGKPDFIGYNYYNSMTVEKPEVKELVLKGSDQQLAFDIPDVFKAFKNDKLQQTKFRWGVDPSGFLQTSRELNDRYGLPILLTENGLGHEDVLTKDGKIHDEYRINFLREHIKLIPQILTEGIDLIGYNPWSAIDLVSTHQGIKKRYGFVYIDRDDEGNGDFKRYKKDSFHWYKKVISSDGEDLD
ncbi:glycoside hydrolase family 1 protein [Spiroplasma endosymbiont of Othius punctulatus]|uniref:glycoside hydrolase family 1 protein n=1 Tax=Spiroplasma endosymbiont of Othius punctulatus TaxID=3066289 RepID=UPI0030CA71B0